MKILANFSGLCYTGPGKTIGLCLRPWERSWSDVPEHLQSRQLALEALRVVLSLLWVVFSLPVVTLGGATAALYDAVVHGFRRHESDYLYRFFTTFRAEWKHGILPTLLCGAVIGGLWFGYTRFTGSASGDAAVMLAAGLLVLLCIPAGAVCWVFPALSRFELETSALLSNSFRLALGHLPATFAMVLAAYGCVWLTAYLLFLPLLLLPALPALFCSLFIERVFKRYEQNDEPKE